MAEKTVKMKSTEIIQAALDHADMNQMELSKKLGVNRATVSAAARRENMGIQLFTHWMNTMGLHVYVGDDGENGADVLWEVDPGNVEPRKQRFSKRTEE